MQDCALDVTWLGLQKRTERPSLALVSRMFREIGAEVLCSSIDLTDVEYLEHAEDGDEASLLGKVLWLLHQTLTSHPKLDTMVKSFSVDLWGGEVCVDAPTSAVLQCTHPFQPDTRSLYRKLP